MYFDQEGPRVMHSRVQLGWALDPSWGRWWALAIRQTCTQKRNYRSEK